MKTGKRANNRKLNNRGISLIELVIVIAIMAVMVGIMSLGLSMMFSRDANYVASKIDDELSEARMYSMSKAGTYTYVLHIDTDTDPKHHFVRLDQTVLNDPDNPDAGTTTTEVRKTAIEKRVKIEVTASEGANPTLDADKNMYFIFNKSNGSLLSVNGVNAKGVYTIKVTSTTNSGKVNLVKLVAMTGRHYIEKE